MPTKIFFSIIFIVILAVAILGGAWFYYNSFKSYNQSQVAAGNGAGGEEEGELASEEDLEQVKQDYPAIITGIIHFLDTKTAFKTIIKTDEGKEYVLAPAEPKVVYETFGVKNGGRVEVRAKFLEGNKINWILMKPI